MSELRRGPIAEKWVIIAPVRGKRPFDYDKERRESPISDPSTCPFCTGKEDLTPREIHRVDGPDGRWLIRVVTNKFPALQSYDDRGRQAVEGFFDRMNGVGAHEVIIESPNHNSRIPDLSVEHVRLILDTYVDRLRALMENPWHRYVLLFKNHGPEAGASLSHPHSQMIATPITPREVRDGLETARNYFERKERCIFCDILSGETRAGVRVVEQSNGYVVLAPYAARFPFELIVYPCEHSHDFTTISGEQRDGLAVTLKRTLGRLGALLGDIPYNFVLQTAPNPIPRVGKPGYWKTLQYDYHWRIEIIPRLTKVAGFEWGTGLYINPVPPEEAARRLREAEIKG